MLQHLGVRQTPCEPLRAFSFLLVVFFKHASVTRIFIQPTVRKRNFTGNVLTNRLVVRFDQSIVLSKNPLEQNGR
jgi:hypothetical protein